MAASAAETGGRAAALPIIGRIFEWLNGTAAAVAALLALGAGAAHAASPGEGIFYVSAAPEEAAANLGADFRQSLAPRFRFALARAANDGEVMARIAEDPRSVGLVQRDLYLAYLGAHAASGTRFEFYGDIPACVVVVVRKGSSIRSFADLTRARAGGPVTLDVGPAGGRAAESFAILRELDPSLAAPRLEHRGGARALGRVIAGDTDAAFFMIDAPYLGSAVNAAVKAGSVDLVPFFSEAIVIGASERNQPYLLRQIRLGDPGWFSSGLPYHTTCTSLGVAVNAASDARLSEAVAQAVLDGDTGAAPPSSWLAARSWPAAPDWLRRVGLAGIGQLLADAMGEARRFAQGIGQVVVAWLGGGRNVNGPGGVPPGGPALAGGGNPALHPAIAGGAAPAPALSPAAEQSRGSP
jgi:hypothetical protein